MSARYAVCEGVQRQGSFAADAALATAAGIAAMGVDHAAVDAVGVRRGGAYLRRRGLRVSSYMGLDDILQADGGVSPVDGVARRFDVAARVGAPAALVVTGPLGSRSATEADSICRDWLAGAAPVAGERAVRIMLEPMHPLMRRWSYVHTLRDALALTEELEGVGVVLDLGHVWWEHGLDALIRAHVDAIVSVQMTNVDSAALAEIRYERAPLNVGDVSLAFLVGLLESFGLPRLVRERGTRTHPAQRATRDASQLTGVVRSAIALVSRRIHGRCAGGAGDRADRSEHGAGPRRDP